MIQRLTMDKHSRFPSFPDVNTLKQRATLYFVNSDPLLEYERALPPHVIPVGGIHMEHPKPLFSVIRRGSVFAKLQKKNYESILCQNIKCFRLFIPGI